MATKNRRRQENCDDGRAAAFSYELALFRDRNVGWAMWEFRGGFGVLDSDRDDVEYEDFHGHKLDRKLLELLRRY